VRNGFPVRLEGTFRGRVLCLLIALSFGIAGVIPARAETGGDAEKLLRLDIMLMVTGLRCRTTSDNFWSEYGQFSAKHLGTLNGASYDLRTDMAVRFGEDAGERSLDRMRVSMANQYGVGHPWLDCGQLKMVASNLSRVEGRATLVEAADQLLQLRPVEHFALAGY
jgi:hypothetical protein